jgi:arsenite methyltransferase
VKEDRVPPATASSPLDVVDLRNKVRHVYETVARDPHDEHLHFEVGRSLAERLGYPPTDLDRIPAAAIDSFAGVGYYFDVVHLRRGERVIDLGSGSGTDTFLAAAQVGEEGHVIGIDMTGGQLEKARRLARAAGITQVEFRDGLIEQIPIDAGAADCVISNGVINLCPDKRRLFAEVARVLRPGGRLALADIVADVPLPPTITCNAALWAACVAGAEQRDDYRAAIEGAGLEVIAWRENAGYAFVSRSAQNATRRFGITSISLLAVKADAR